MTRRLMAPLALFALLLTLVAGPTPGVAAAKTQTCPNEFCTFALPDDFADMSKTEPFRTYRDTTTNDLFILLVVQAPPDAVLNDVVNGAVIEYAKRDGYVAVGNVRDETIGGMRGKSFAYEARDSGGTAIHHEAFFVLRSGSVVNLNFVVVPERVAAVAPTADLVLASFQFPQP